MPILPDIDPVSGVTTTADLIARVRDLVGEETADFYTDATEFLPDLRDGARRIFSQLPILLTSGSATVTAHVAQVTVPEDVGRYARVLLGTTELSPMRAEDFVAADTTEGIPASYCPDFVGSNGLPVLKLSPPPSTSGTLTIHYWRLPTLTTEIGPSWHLPYHFLPCYYAAGVMLHKDNRPEMAELMMGKFEAGIRDYKQWFYSNQPKVDEITQAVTVGDM